VRFPTAAMMRVRLRGPQGQAVLQFEGSTLGALRSAVASSDVGCSVERQELRAGHPPVLLSGSDDVALESVGVRTGDSLMLTVIHTDDSTGGQNGAGGNGQGTGPEGYDEDEMLARAIAASLGEDFTSAGQGQRQGQGQGQQQHGSVGKGGGVIVRRVVDDDNSCLFNALAYVWAGTRADGGALRGQVVECIRSDPAEFNEGFLGKTPEAYCRWILDRDHWGGAIELYALATHLQVEIAAYDATSNREDVYGQGKGYDTLVCLVYDGIHYDALAVSPYAGAPEREDATRFSTRSGEAERARRLARQFCAQLHADKKFTDTASFALRCSICRAGLKGEREATEHARATGHGRFEEYA